HRAPAARSCPHVREPARGGVAGAERRQPRRVLRAVQRSEGRRVLRARRYRRRAGGLRGGADRFGGGVAEPLVRGDEARRPRGRRHRGDRYVTTSRVLVIVAAAALAGGCSLFGGRDSTV